MKKITFTLTFLLFQALSFAQPPEPPIGYRWVLFDQYSDEFNGSTLDQTKWRDTFNGWKGRPPAKFDPSTITVQGGDLQIKNKKLAAPDGPYTIAGGAVQSLNQTAHFGYYECKFKASRISMSTTFWMSNDKINIIGPTNLSDDCPNDKWSQELDIIESIGGDFDKPWASGFRTKMNFNTHYRYVDCNGAPEVFYSAGNNAVEGNGQEADANLVGSESWEDYHTYGCYWIDNKTFDFYVDTNYAGTVKARTDVVDTPFSEPMGINMVTETYDFATPYPNDNQLADNGINTSYYDWVRSYRLFPIDQPESETSSEDLLAENGDFENGNLNGWTGWGGTIREVANNNAFEGAYAAHIQGAGAHERVVTLKANTDYILSAYSKIVSGSINFGIKENITNAAGITNQILTNTSYEKATLEFNTGDKTNLKLFFYAPAATDEAFGDNFELIEKNPSTNSEIIEVFTEDITFTSQPVLNTNNKEVSIAYLYKANQNREFQFHIFNDVGTEVFTSDFVVLEGFGKNETTIALDNELPTGTYTISADIRPIGSSNEEIIDTTDDFFVLDTPEFKKEDFKVAIFPNPAQSHANITTFGVEGKTKIFIFNTLGQLQLKDELQNNTMVLNTNEHISTGIYFVVLKNGNRTSIKKLIIK